MEQVTIDRILSLIKELSGEQKEYMEKYLNNAPVWLLESFHILRLQEDTIFVRENEDVDFVYILVKGSIKAIDYRILGINYDYMWLHAVKTFGTMEILLGLDKYQTTLMTASPCTILSISKSKFEKWMTNNKDILLMESKMMVSYLLEQAKRERIFMLMQGMDRVAFLLMQMYDEKQEDGLCELKLTRQELSDCSGLSVKTINRSITRLLEEDYIGRDGNRITITRKQYKKMNEFIATKVDQ